MKTIVQIILIFAIIGFLTCCTNQCEQLEIEENPDIFDGKSAISSTPELTGIWINTSNIQDTLKITDTLITRWNPLSETFWHYYRYSIKDDTIVLNYLGKYKILLPPFHRKYSLNESMDTFQIQGFETTYPGYEGEEFIKISK